MLSFCAGVVLNLDILYEQGHLFSRGCDQPDPAVEHKSPLALSTSFCFCLQRDGFEKTNKNPQWLCWKDGSSVPALLLGIEDLRSFQGKFHSWFLFFIPQLSFQYDVGLFFGKKPHKTT